LIIRVSDLVVDTDLIKYDMIEFDSLYEDPAMLTLEDVKLLIKELCRIVNEAEIEI